MGEGNTKIKPHYWGVWANYDGGRGLFFVVITGKEGRRVHGQIFDDIGVAEFKGRLGGPSIRFKKRYIQSTKPPANKTWMTYEGQRELRLNGEYQGTYRSRKANGTFTMSSVPESSTIDTLFEEVRSGKSILYRF